MHTGESFEQRQISIETDFSSDFSINPTPCDRLRKMWLTSVMQDAIKFE